MRTVYLSGLLRNIDGCSFAVWGTAVFIGYDLGDNDQPVYHSAGIKRGDDLCLWVTPSVVFLCTCLWMDADVVLATWIQPEKVSVVSRCRVFLFIFWNCSRSISKPFDITAYFKKIIRKTLKL